MRSNLFVGHDTGSLPLPYGLGRLDSVHLLVSKRGACGRGGARYISPKIHPVLIRRIYHLAKARGMPITHLVNQLFTQKVEGLEHEGESVSNPPIGANPPHKRKKEGVSMANPSEREKCLKGSSEIVCLPWQAC
jgi:hypothetical protein